MQVYFPPYYLTKFNFTFVFRVCLPVLCFYSVVYTNILGLVFIEIELNTPERRRLNGYSVTAFCTKYLWIRLALLEKVLTTIINSLVENWRYVIVS